MSENIYGRNSIYLERRNALTLPGATEADALDYSREAATRFGAPLFNPANAPWAAGLPAPTGTIGPVLPSPSPEDAAPAANPGTPRRGTIPRARVIDENDPEAGMFDPAAPGGRQAETRITGPTLPSLPSLGSVQDWALRGAAFVLGLVILIDAFYMLWSNRNA